MLSWVFTTQGIAAALQAARALAQAGGTTRLAATGLNLSQISASLPNVADVYIGTQDLPYYLAIPSAQNPTAALTGFWKAAPGAYQPPFNQAGLTTCTLGAPKMLRAACCKIRPMPQVASSVSSGRP